MENIKYLDGKMNEGHTNKLHLRNGEELINKVNMRKNEILGKGRNTYYLTAAILIVQNNFYEIASFPQTKPRALCVVLSPAM